MSLNACYITPNINSVSAMRNREENNSDRIKLTDLVLGPHKMVDNMAAGSVAAAVAEPPELKASSNNLPSINKLKDICKLNVIYRISSTRALYLPVLGI
jgi:hypothetical protein